MHNIKLSSHNSTDDDDVKITEKWVDDGLRVFINQLWLSTVKLT